MSLIFYPLEFLLVIALGIGLFRFFVWLLNSPRLDNVIEKVVHPAATSEDGVVEKVEETLVLAREQVEKTEKEIKQKAAKNARLRKSYGGGE